MDYSNARGETLLVYSPMPIQDGVFSTVGLVIFDAPPKILGIDFHSEGEFLVLSPSVRLLKSCSINSAHVHGLGWCLQFEPPFDVTPPFLLTDHKSMHVVFDGDIDFEPTDLLRIKMKQNPTYRDFPIVSSGWVGVIHISPHWLRSPSYRLTAFSEQENATILSDQTARYPNQEIVGTFKPR